MKQIQMKTAFLTGILTLLSVICFSQDKSLFQKKLYTTASGDTLPYRLLYPQNYNPKQKYPVILFLHGAGERGHDNEKQLVHGTGVFLAQAFRNSYPCIAIFPQCPENRYWSSVIRETSGDVRRFTFDYSKPVMPELEMAVAIVKQVLRKEGGDKNRVYIAGLSMGGMGTFEAVYRYPGLFAAASPICGGGDDKMYGRKTTKTAFRIYHGDQDNVVNVQESRKMYQKLKELNARVSYIEYPGVQHNSWDNAFLEPDFLSWMFDIKRK